MKCDRCNFENPDDKTHCINCGKKLPKKVESITTYLIIESSKKKQERYNIEENNANDYYNVSYKGPDNIQKIESTNKEKKLWIAVVLSLFIVGTGHFYLKKYIRGLNFLMINVILGIVSLSYPNIIVLVFVNSLYQIIDVIRCYKKLNEK